MVERMSTTGSLMHNRYQIMSNNSKFGELQYQIATGRKHADLKDYGADAARIIDLSQEIDSREAYMRTISLTELTASAYDTSLERMVDILKDLLNAADPVSSADTNWAADNEVLADNLLLDMQTNMNMEIGGRYIFGGTNFTEPPVSDMRALKTYTRNDLTSLSAPDNVVELRNQVPEHIIDLGGAGDVESYLSKFAGTGTIDVKAWEKAKVTIANNQQVEYGITAAESPFQNAVESLMRFKAATQPGLTTAERDEFLADARTLADTTRNEMRHLQATNGVFMNELANAKDLHNNFITISEIALDGITVADTAQAATKISALQTMLQASFTTIAKKSQLSLVNFL